jgi:hypothetical protein
MKVLKVILFCILGVIIAGLVGFGCLCFIVGLFGMFDTLSKNYPDIYAFTVVILVGMLLFKVGWIFLEILLNRHK